jgi:hypothetical protein
MIAVPEKVAREREQVATAPTCVVQVMNCPGFARGVEDKRAGHTPRFDDYAVDRWWSYERGRQFAAIAPVSMAIKIDGNLNPKAVALFKAAIHRGFLL